MSTGLTVLHLSDLHFGDPEYFWTTAKAFPAAARPVHDRPTLLSTLIADLRHLQAKHGLWPDLVLVSGDLLYRSSPLGVEPCAEFLSELADAIGLGRERIVLCPGNHDVDRGIAKTDPEHALVPYVSIWNRFYQPVSSLVAPLEERAGVWSRCRMFTIGDGVAVLSLNSCEALDEEHDYRHGYVGKKQLDRAAELLAKANLAPNTFRIGLLHHHLSQFHGAVGEDYSILREVRRVLDWLRNHAFHLVVHGHQHCSGLDVLVLRHNAMTITAGGSTGVSIKGRTQGSVPLQYQILHFHDPRGGVRFPRKFNPQREEWQDNADEEDHTILTGSLPVPDFEGRVVGTPGAEVETAFPSPLPHGSPFHWRHQLDPAWFVDREEQLEDAIEFIVPGSSVSVVTPARGGRSSFLAALAVRLRKSTGFDRQVYAFDLQRSLVEGITGLLRRFCQAMGGIGTTDDVVEELLKKQPRPPVFLLDEFEVLAHESFDPTHVPAWLRSLANDGLLTLVAATPKPLRELFPNISGSPLNLFRRIDLEPFNRGAAEVLWQKYLAGTEIRFEEAQKQAIYEWSAGHPCRLMIGSDHLYRALRSQKGADWREPARREWREIGS